MMKYISILILLISLESYSQNALSTIEINEASINVEKSLPYDIPIQLKIKFSDYVELKHVSLVKIKKQTEYYNMVFGKESSFLSDFSEFDNDTLVTKNLTYRAVSNSDKSWTYVILIPPLDPGNFYDIKIIRRLKNSEVEDYFKMFEYKFKNDSKMYLNKINEISAKQAPFELLDLNDDPDIIGMNDYYERNDLSKYYTIIDTTSIAELKKTTKEKIIEIIKTSNIKRGDDANYDLNMLVGQSLSATTTSFSFDTRVKSRISPDFGYVYYGFQDDISGIVPYVGFHFELRPYNKDVPYKFFTEKPLLSRFSFHTGITLSSIKKENRREDLFAGKSLLTGLSFRFSNAIRITGGALIFNQENSNLLIDDKRLATVPFVGLSIDLSVKSIVNDISGLIPLNRK